MPKDKSLCAGEDRLIDESDFETFDNTLIHDAPPLGLHRVTDGVRVKKEGDKLVPVAIDIDLDFDVERPD